MPTEEPSACREGYYQHEAVALGCDAGTRKKAVVLTPIDTPQRAFYWRAPAGTKDLRLDVDLRPVDGPGSAALSVQCEHNDLEPLVDATIGALNQRVRSTEMYGAQWSWSGEPEVPSNESFREWFRINGTLGCDIELVLSNIYLTALFGSFEYSWDGIDPCPETLKGCAPCPDDVCSEDERAFCDGGRYWECIPADDIARVTITAAVTTSSAPASGSTEAIPRLPASPSANVEWARGIMATVLHFLGPALIVLLALAVGFAIIFGLRYLMRLCWQRIYRKQVQAKVQEEEEDDEQFDEESQSYSSSRSESEPGEVAPLLSVQHTHLPRMGMPSPPTDPPRSPRSPGSPLGTTENVTWTTLPDRQLPVEREPSVQAWDGGPVMVAVSYQPSGDVDQQSGSQNTLPDRFL